MQDVQISIADSTKAVTITLSAADYAKVEELRKMAGNGAVRIRVMGRVAESE